MTQAYVGSTISQRMHEEYPEYAVEEYHDMLRVFVAVGRQALIEGSTINLPGLGTLGTKVYEKRVVGQLEGQRDGVKKWHRKVLSIF